MLTHDISTRRSRCSTALEGDDYRLKKLARCITRWLLLNGAASCHKLSVTSDLVSGFIAWLMADWLCYAVPREGNHGWNREVVTCLKDSVIPGHPRSRCNSDTSITRGETVPIEEANTSYMLVERVIYCAGEPDRSASCLDGFSHRARTLSRTRIYRTKINSVISDDNFGFTLLFSPGTTQTKWFVQIQIIKFYTNCLKVFTQICQAINQDTRVLRRF